MAGGGTGASVAPHFGFSVGTWVACGTVISFNLHITSAQVAWEDAFTVTVGQLGVGTPVTAFSESFDGTTFPPAGWGQSDVSGTVCNWARSTNTVHPGSGGTHSGAGLAYFDSYTSASGSSTRLYRSNGFSIPATLASASVTFWMYHDKSDTSGDQIQIQVSTSGTDWTNLGTAISRYNGSSGWSQHGMSLNDYIGATSVQVGFLGMSSYGNDCHIDDVLVTYTPPGACSMHACDPLTVPGETASGGTAATAQSWTGTTTHGWPAVSGATGYTLYRGVLADLPQLLNSSADSCTKTSGSATSVTMGDDPAGVAGRFYWYLVTASNGAGEGTPGNTTEGAKILNSTGPCP